MDILFHSSPLLTPLAGVNGPRPLYEQLLPASNGKPFAANVSDSTEWRPMPRSGDRSHGCCALAALRCALRLAALGPEEAGATYLAVLSVIAGVAQANAATAAAAPGGLTLSDRVLLQVRGCGLP